MNLEFPIHHVIVVGFHHKKGCQVEYAFPPLEIELEKTAWKYLPTLAIPDGAHNFDHDTVYFHLPSLKNQHETVFGVACYQQIDSTKLINRPEDVTRSTVQKSVCVLSRYPLFGHIQVKMQLITAAYFREGDFEQVSILQEAFHNLNACLVPELLKTPEAFVGLSPRELVFNFRHQVLILFKLLLLERKILFRGASVGPLCSALLTLVSLLPLVLEFGLNQAACTKTSKTLSIVPQFSHEEGTDEDDNDKSGDDCRKNNTANATRLNRRAGNTQAKNQMEDNRDLDNSTKVHYKSMEENVDFRRKKSPEEPEQSWTYDVPTESPTNSVTAMDVDEPPITDRSVEVPDFLTAVQMSPQEAGFPLQLFKKGYLCHPYLSLHYLDLLTDSRVKGFLIGTTNVLFKQKKDLVDVIVEMQDCSVDILDQNLKKQVVLTTPDLRFAETLVRQVTLESERRMDGDSFMDGVGWEGGDEWIRSQFKYYLVSALRTSLIEEGDKQRDSFGAGFLTMWQNTHNWKTWRNYVMSEERDTPGIYNLCPGHPCDGGVSVTDVKIRFTHSMQSSESGRRLNLAVQNTGKAVLQTGKAVGGALTSAKGAFSSWWNTVTSPNPNVTPNPNPVANIPDSDGHSA